jgi:antitoxin component YwqK of YwqJK toxin-antitoxin module
MKYIILAINIFLTFTLNAQEIVKQENLRFEDDKYYLDSTNALFYGISATYFPNGQAESYTYVQNGYETGEFKIFFDSGSKRIVVTRFSLKNSNAFKLEVWNEDGTRAFRGKKINGIRYKRGKRKPFSGTIVIHYLNGTKAETSEFKEGKWHGKQIRFNRQGEIDFECIFENNEIIDCPIYRKG